MVVVEDERCYDIYWGKVNSEEEYINWLLELWDKHSYETGGLLYNFTVDTNVFDDSEEYFFNLLGCLDEDFEDENIYPDVHSTNKYKIRNQPKSYPAIVQFNKNNNIILFVELNKFN